MTEDDVKNQKIIIHEKASKQRLINGINKIIKTSRQLTQELGRTPTVDEISKKLLIPAKKIRKVLMQVLALLHTGAKNTLTS